MQQTRRPPDLISNYGIIIEYIRSNTYFQIGEFSWYCWLSSDQCCQSLLLLFPENIDTKIFRHSAKTYCHWQLGYIYTVKLSCQINWASCSMQKYVVNQFEWTMKTTYVILRNLNICQDFGWWYIWKQKYFVSVQDYIWVTKRQM